MHYISIQTVLFVAGTLLAFASIVFVPLVSLAHHATPEWTDHNDHDPGITLKAPASALRGGTEDINIGVGELWEGENETDLNVLRERARRIHEVKVRFPWER